jgi:predicted nucleotidyltransferase component of viral defense system
MITKAQITKCAARDGVPAKTVERDYVLAHIIAGLTALGDKHGMVFKGGTALRLCFFEDYRYSADLDFSMVEGTKADGYEIIEAALIEANEVIDTLYLTEQSPAKIAYLGPLGRQRTLKLDIADDELVINTEAQTLLPRWDDLPTDSYVSVYTLNEIAGEKLRCVMQRLQCRDLFDLALLFDEAQVDVLDAAEVFRPKATHRGLDPENFANKYDERVEQYRERWHQELGEHVAGDVPHFEALERRVARELRRANLI